MKSRVLKVSMGLITAISMLGGCATSEPLVNMTSELIQQNPSGIYSLSVKRDVPKGPLSEGQMRVVIGGKVYPMVRAPGMDGIYTFDYAIEDNANRALYYFEWVDASGRTLSATPVNEFRLANRYVELESTRAQPGRTVAILGRGFRDSDAIIFGGMPIPSHFISPNQLQFEVPAMDAGRSYLVEVKTQESTLSAGTFRIDFSQLRSMPQRVDFSADRESLLVFSVDYDAPPTGIPLTVVSTPRGIVDWDPCLIEEGTRSVSMRIRGLKPGEATLTVEAKGHNKLTIPVMIR